MPAIFAPRVKQTLVTCHLTSPVPPLLFNNLPIGLDPASVQVSAQARGDIVLGPVYGRVIRAEPKRETMTL